MPTSRKFLPWYDKGFTSGLPPQPSGGESRAAIPGKVGLDGRDGTGRKSSLPAWLEGPGDVVRGGVVRARRLEPYDGCPMFEPAYFPYVELDDPDMPWRHSPFGREDLELTGGAAAQAVRRRRPWIALVVVEAGLSELSPAGPEGLPILTTPVSELPDPDEAWAWVHVQVIVDDGQTLQESVTNPDRVIARLVCPRALKGDTTYRACVVPVFDIGRAAGTGDRLRSADDPLAPAWVYGSDEKVRLPVYVHWSFSTARNASFEALAQKLVARQPPDESDGRVISVADPGWGAAVVPGANVLMQGALRPVADVPTERAGVWSDDLRSVATVRAIRELLGGSRFPGVGGPPAQPVADPTRLVAEGLAAAVSGPPDRAAIQLRPPLYGQDAVGGATSVSAADPGWFAELNTDPRRRMAAGLGVWAVTVEQERLVDQAWQQLPPENRRDPVGAAADTAAAVRASLASRHAGAVQAVLPTLARLARAGGPNAPLGPVQPLRPQVTPDAVFPPPISPPTGFTPATFLSRRHRPPVATFAPKFTQPAYTLLRAVSPDWLLPGWSGIPANSVVLVRTNPAFVEAFLMGATDGLTDELVWRRYPVRTGATLFGSFWDTDGDDMEPVSQWPAGSALGSHQTADGGDEQLVLLIRGQLLAAFPTATVTLVRTVADGTEKRLKPNIAGRLAADTSFFGFPLSPSAAEAADPPWVAAISEDAAHTRFGADEASSGTGGDDLGSWQDITWAHPHLSGKLHVPVVGPLVGTRLPTSADVPDRADETAAWPKDSGHLAVALSQPQFVVSVPLTCWLQPPKPPR